MLYRNTKGGLKEEGMQECVAEASIPIIFFPAFLVRDGLYFLSESYYSFKQALCHGYFLNGNNAIAVKNAISFNLYFLITV